VPTTRVPSPLGVTNGAAMGNLWNTVSSAGRIRQCYGSHGLSTQLALNGIHYRGGGPAGFPEVGYGRNLNDAPFCASRCPSTRFPVRLTALPSGRNGLAATVRYRLGRRSPRGLNFNVAYDLWLERAPHQGRRPQGHDIEVMISLKRRGIVGCGAGSTSWTSGIVVNGRRVRAHWRTCNFIGGSNARFVPVLLESPSISRGTIGLALKPLIARAVRENEKADPSARWRTYSLMGVEFGTEVGFCAVQPCNETALNFSFSVSRLVLRWGSSAIPVVSTR
jgi:hypothetical protein